MAGIPLTAVITRRIKPGRERDFETAMAEFREYSCRHDGFLGMEILKPFDPRAQDYTIVSRFRDETSRRAFTQTAGFEEWMVRLRELSEADPQIKELGGLAGWFVTPDHPQRRPPPNWKMAVVVFIGVLPLAWFIPLLVARIVPVAHPLLSFLAINGLIVAALTWIMIPLLSRTMRGWLFPE